MEDSSKKILTILGITAGVGAVAYLLLKPTSASAAAKNAPKVGTSLTPAQIAQIRAAGVRNNSAAAKTSNTTNALATALSQLLKPTKTNPAPNKPASSGPSLGGGSGSGGGGGAAKAPAKPAPPKTSPGQPVSTEDASKGIDSVNADGSIDYSDGSTLLPDGTLVSESGEVLQTGVQSYDPNTGNIDFNDGYTLEGNGILYNSDSVVVGQGVDSYSRDENGNYTVDYTSGMSEINGNLYDVNNELVDQSGPLPGDFVQPPSDPVLDSSTIDENGNPVGDYGGGGTPIDSTIDSSYDPYASSVSNDLYTGADTSSVTPDTQDYASDPYAYDSSSYDYSSDY
jgi:hypothetical protein